MAVEVLRKLIDGVWRTVVADAGGNGGSLPAEWDVTDGELLMSPTDSTGDDLLRVNAPVGYHQSSGQGYIIRAFAGDGTEVLNFDPSGALNITAAIEEGTQPSLTLTDVPSGGNTVQISAPGPALEPIVVGANSAIVFRVLNSGAITTTAHAAPADNVLIAGECALWFDATPGASKLMVKAKDSDGTVRSTAIALT